VAIMTDAECGNATSSVYFIDASGPTRVRFRQLPGSIGVQESLDSPMPIGIATEIGWTSGGLAV
jgi:hypothetical protein